MGKLVQFESRGKGSTSAREERAAGAEILIFTGVRYERQIDAKPTKPPTASSSGGKRKRG